MWQKFKNVLLQTGWSKQMCLGRVWWLEWIIRYPLNSIVPLPVNKSCTMLCSATSYEKGTWTEGRESTIQMDLFSLHLCYPFSTTLFYWVHFSGHRQIVPATAKYILISTVLLPSYCYQIAYNHSPCEANKVKWSQQIMQTGYEVKCQCKTGLMSPAWKYAGWV